MIDKAIPRLPTVMPPEQQASIVDAVSDADLIALVRSGDTAAYDELFLRHRDVAFRLARHLTDSERADDLVAESFARILDLLRREKGPDVAFRAYLLTTVRTVHLNQVRRSRESATEDRDLEGLSTPVEHDPDARFDETAIARAFRGLPERWQSALWLTAVEGRPTEEVSRHLGIRSNAVASLAFRARAGLRQAYLAEHLRQTADVECARISEQLPGYLRGSLTPRRRAVVEAHLDRCSRCSVAAAELADVDRRLGALLAPALLGSAAIVLWPATVNLPAVPAVAGILAGHGVAPGFLGALSRGVEVIRGAGIGAVAAAAVVVAVVHGSTGAGTTEDTAAVPIAGAVVPAPPAPPVAPTPTSTPAVLPPAPAAGPPASPVPAPRPVKPRATLAPAGTPAPPAAAAPAQAPATTLAASPAITSLTSTGTAHGNTTWYQVDITTSGLVPGSTLRLTSGNTTDIHLTGATTKGWTCGTPETADGLTAMTCTYDGHGGAGDGSLQLDYEIDAATTLRVELGDDIAVVNLG